MLKGEIGQGRGGGEVGVTKQAVEERKRNAKRGGREDKKMLVCEYSM